MRGDIVLVFDERVLNDLLEIGTCPAQLWQLIDDFLYQMEPVETVLHPHIEGGGDRAFFAITVDVQIAIGPAIGHPVNQ